MIWPTLDAVRSETRSEERELESVYHYLRLPSGRWARTVGRPTDPDAFHLAERCWALPYPEPRAA